MDKKVKPRKTRIDAILDEDIAKAFKKTHGMQTHAAELLGVTGACISKRVRQSPYLQQALEECTERGLDDAEIALRELILEKNLGAVCFLLKTKGKHRGFTENTQQIISPEIASMFAAQMNQLAALQSDRKNAQIKT